MTEERWREYRASVDDALNDVLRLKEEIGALHSVQADDVSLRLNDTQEGDVSVRFPTALSRQINALVLSAKMIELREARRVLQLLLDRVTPSI